MEGVFIDALFFYSYKLHMKIAITGATGLIGSALARALKERGETVVILSRNPEQAKEKLGVDAQYAQWPGSPEVFEGTDAVIHLAGEPIADKRWSDSQKKKIRDSRTVGTRELVQALERCKVKPRTLISASAIGIYGSRADEILNENSFPAKDFLAEVCRDWEKEASAFSGRVVLSRNGIVLSQSGGAFPKMILPFKFGAGGTLGNGKQWMSWIHIDDMVQLILFALDRSEIVGPINAVSPSPVTNKEFTEKLAGAMHRPALFPVPPFALKLAVGEVADAILSSQRVLPTRLVQNGFRFKYVELSAALNELLLHKPS